MGCEMNENIITVSGEHFKTFNHREFKTFLVWLSIKGKTLILDKKDIEKLIDEKNKRGEV